jgi:hypothetical protein
MKVTLFGMVMPVRLVQFENAEFPMEVTQLGMETLVRLSCMENACSPILVTGMLLIVSGIVTDLLS